MTLDHIDAAILDTRQREFEKDTGPRVGDFVRFACGTTRRISHIWNWEDDWDIQTSDAHSGHFYLGDGYVSHSGSLHPPVRKSTLKLTNEVRSGSVWFFHHNHRRAHNGVDTEMPFRVYNCNQEAT